MSIALSPIALALSPTTPAIATPVGATIAVANSNASRAAGLNYESHARAILRDSEFEDANFALLEMDELLERQFVRARVGLYDLYMHRGTFSERRNAEKFQTVCDTMLAQQQAWLDWMAPARKDLKTVFADIELLREWVQDWSSTDLRRIEGGSVFDSMAKRGKKKDKYRAAAERLAEYMGKGGSLDLGREAGRYEKLILGPTRESFVQLVCFAGMLRPELQGIYWQPGITNWTQSYVDDYKFVALQYTAPGTTLGSIGSGLEMNYASKTGLEQQVTQLATNWMLSNYFGERIPPSLAGGLAVNLVIDTYGRCETRVDGDLRERRTEAREVFVPGGNPNGGILPPNSAESHWREGGGQNHFTKVLRKAQKSGSEKERRSKDKLRHFQLLDDNEVSRTVVHGPYLGTAAAASEAPPASFYGDRLEFLRAYRSCFLNWLRTKGGGSGKTSSKKFAELLMEIAHSEDSSALEGTIAKAFKTDALSTEKLGTKDLEGRFLKWLSKQK
ncbi:MAG: hypothetical protein ACI841_000462 [Planctomycetota bacterium]|jgi:hypothetical protein